MGHEEVFCRPDPQHVIHTEEGHCDGLYTKKDSTVLHSHVFALGKIFGILITFLGVGMVAIPTGIISAGFVDQYSRITVQFLDALSDPRIIFL